MSQVNPSNTLNTNEVAADLTRHPHYAEIAGALHRVGQANRLTHVDDYFGAITADLQMQIEGLDELAALRLFTSFLACTALAHFNTVRSIERSFHGVALLPSDVYRRRRVPHSFRHLISLEADPAPEVFSDVVCQPICTAGLAFRGYYTDRSGEEYAHVSADWLSDRMVERFRPPPGAEWQVFHHHLGQGNFAFEAFLVPSADKP